MDKTVSIIDKFKLIFDQHLKNEENAFEDFKKFLLQFKSEEEINEDKCLVILFEDFIKIIEEKETTESKQEEFKEMVREIKCHLLKKERIKLPGKCVLII